MITEDYVSFEIAKLLKEKGFYQDFLSEITPVWKLNGNRTELAFYGCDNYPCETDEWYSAPTLQMAMKWLREIKDIYIDVTSRFSFNADNDVCFSYFMKQLAESTSNPIAHRDGEWLTYEEACESAIKYCLENLI